MFEPGSNHDELLYELITAEDPVRYKSKGGLSKRAKYLTHLAKWKDQDKKEKGLLGRETH